MRLNEFDKPLNEAMPMGGLQKLGQTVRSKLPTFDPTGSAQAKGKLESGKLANKLVVDYNQFLGQIRQAPTPTNVLQFLTKAGYATKNAVADLKKNVKPAQPIREKAPSTTATPSRLSLTPKELALEPNEPTAPRKDITNPSAPAARPAPAAAIAAPIPQPKPGQSSIANVTLNQKQINSAFMAAATEYYAGATATGQLDNSQSVEEPAKTGPSLAKAFTSGFKGDYMPQDSGTTTPQLDLSDPRSLVALVRQMNRLVRGGEKLDPQTKQTLQQLITKL